MLYSLPDESTASFAGSQMCDMLDDDQQMLIDIEQNIANLERTLTTAGTQGSERDTRTTKRGSSSNKASVPSDRKRSSTLKSVRSLIRSVIAHEGVCYFMPKSIDALLKRISKTECLFIWSTGIGIGMF